MVEKTRVKKLPQKRMTRKQRGGDPMIEVIIGDINTLNKRITKKYTDGSSFKTQMIDPFNKIALDINQKMKDDVSTKYLDKLSNTLSTFLSSIRLNQQRIESVPADSHSSGSLTDKEMNPTPKGRVQIFTGLNQASLTQFYPNSYSVVIPQEIQGLLEAIRDKKESMSKIEAIAIQRKAEQDAAARLKKEQQDATVRLKKEQQDATVRLKKEKAMMEQQEREQKEREQKEAKMRQEEEKTQQKEAKVRQEEERRTAKLEIKKKNIAELEENVRLKKEQLENEKMKTEESDRRTYLFRTAKEEEKKKKNIVFLQKRLEKRDLEAKQAELIEQFTVEIASLFDKFSGIFAHQFEALHDPKTLVSIINKIYPNVVHYTEKIDTQDKQDAQLYKLYSFQLFILIGMLNRFLKTRAPELKLVIKGGKAAQMILSPKPTLDVKSDDIDVLVQHPDPLYATIFSQQFAAFFEQQTRDNDHISILLANPTNPNVVKISYITKDDKFVVISDIDSKPVLHQELFELIETGKSKDVVIDEDGVETAYPFRLTYYHQTHESFLKEKKYYRDLYLGLPPSDINSRFAAKASDYLTMMAPEAPPPSPSSPENIMPPVPPSPK
jgi:hypothetical protein